MFYYLNNGGRTACESTSSGSKFLQTTKSIVSQGFDIYSSLTKIADSIDKKQQLGALSMRA